MEIRTYSNSLEDENSKIRASAIIEMGRTGNRDAIESIIEVLENAEEVDWVRACAAIALGKLSNGEVTPSLIDALQNDDIIVCRAAISALGDTGNRQAIPHLEEIFHNMDKEELHAVTIKVIGEIGGDEIIPVLLQALESSNDFVRVRAALALCELRTDQAVPHFLGLIKDGNESLRAIAASSLGLMADKRAVKPLLVALDDKAETVRAVAVSSLGCVADSSVIPILEKALEDDSKVVRKQAAGALSKIKLREGNNSTIDN